MELSIIQSKIYEIRGCKVMVDFNIMRAFVILRQYAFDFAELNRKLEDFMIETDMQFNEILKVIQTKIKRFEGIFCFFPLLKSIQCFFYRTVFKEYFSSFLFRDMYFIDNHSGPALN